MLSNEQKQENEKIRDRYKKDYLILANMEIKRRNIKNSYEKKEIRNEYKARAAYLANDEIKKNKGKKK